jgi:hypothetical protein
MMIEPPATAAPTGAVSFDVRAPCVDDAVVASFPASVSTFGRCDADVPVVLIARGPMTFEDPGEPLAFATARAGTDLVARPSAWSTACKQVVVGSDLGMDVALWPRFVTHTFRGIDLYFCPPAGEAVPALDLGEGAVVRAIGYARSPNYSVSLLKDFAAVPASVEIDSRSDLLTGELELDAFDAAGARWRRDGSLANADAVDVTLEWPHELINFVVWRFVLPPDATSVAVPEIPAELATWGTIESGLHGIVTVRHVEASWLIGLADVHGDLPLVLDGMQSKRDIPRASALRDAVHTFMAQVE